MDPEETLICWEGLALHSSRLLVPRLAVLGFLLRNEALNEQKRFGLIGSVTLWSCQMMLSCRTMWKKPSQSCGCCQGDQLNDHAGE